MAKRKNESQAQPNPESEAVAAPGATEPTGPRLEIDDTHAVSYYAPTARVWGTSEEIVADFAQRLTPSGENTTTMKIDARVIMSPWAAKRLVMAMHQAVQRYEKAYGTIQLDPRQRGGASATGGQPNPEAGGQT